jgi:hypothetical protein
MELFGLFRRLANSAKLLFCGIEQLFCEIRDFHFATPYTLFFDFFYFWVLLPLGKRKQKNIFYF